MAQTRLERLLILKESVKDCMADGLNMEKERQRIGQRFAEERKSVEWVDANGINRKGMTQAELAERCGLLQSNIARVERGYFSARFDTLEAMAEGLGKKIDIV